MKMFGPKFTIYQNDEVRIYFFPDLATKRKPIQRERLGRRRGAQDAADRKKKALAMRSCMIGRCPESVWIISSCPRQGQAEVLEDRPCPPRGCSRD